VRFIGAIRALSGFYAGLYGAKCLRGKLYTGVWLPIVRLLRGGTKTALLDVLKICSPS
jgi:hypothetical protein